MLCGRESQEQVVLESECAELTLNGIVEVVSSKRDDHGRSRAQIKFELLVVDGACWLSMSMVRGVNVVVDSKWFWK